MTDIETTIFRGLLRDSNYVETVLPFLKNEYFTNHYRVVYESIAEYFEKYGHPPSLSELDIEIDNRKPPEKIRDAAKDYIYSLDLKEPIEVKWLIEQTEQFCKDKALYNAMVESLAAMQGENKVAVSAIPDIILKALGTSFDTRVGHNYFDDASNRFEYYHREVAKIGCDIDMLNRITRGGLERKTLNCILAPTGVGKTLLMCHLSASYIARGYNVLYVTLEMAEEKIAERIDANLMNVDIDRLESMDRESYIRKIADIRCKCPGKLVIKEYPATTTHVGHIRYLLRELKLKGQFVPDILVIDYLNLCISTRTKMGGTVNMYSYIKAIAEELRGLATEQNIAVLTATQTVRDAQTADVLELTDVAESSGLAHTLDLLIGLTAPEELERLNQMMFHQLKNRYNDVKKFSRFVVGVDRSKFKFFDVEVAAQPGRSVAEALSTSTHVEKKDFSGFKV